MRDSFIGNFTCSSNVSSSDMIILSEDAAGTNLKVQQETHPEQSDDGTCKSINPISLIEDVSSSDMMLRTKSSPLLPQQSDGQMIT